MKRRMIALALTLVSATASAQIFGTAKLISQTTFCKKYACQYIKAEPIAEGINWTYYISSRFNFELYREPVKNTTLATSASIRFVGGIPTQADLNFMSEAVKTFLGKGVSVEELRKCGSSINAEHVLYDPLNGSDIQYHVSCGRYRNDDVLINFTPYGNSNF